MSTWEIIKLEISLWQDAAYHKFTNSLLPFVNWRRVRSIGELSILTRASYTAFLIIPFIAACWLPIKNSIGKIGVEREAVEASVKSFEKRIDKIAEYSPENLTKVEAKKVKEHTDSFTAKVKELVQTLAANIPALTLKIPVNMTRTFFASLLIIIAHFLYQLCAPKEFRANDIDDFVSAHRKRFMEEPSATALAHAHYIIDDAKTDENLYNYQSYTKQQATDFKERFYFDQKRKLLESEEEGKHVDFINSLSPADLTGLCNRYQEVLKIASASDEDLGFFEKRVKNESPEEPKIKEIIDKLEKARNSLPPEAKDLLDRMQKISHISSAAHIEYYRLSEAYPYAALVSMLCYGSAIVLIFLVLFDQINVVIKASS